MVCLRGESLTTHRNQMKLFAAIATAAVIGASLIATTPAEAQSRNGWIYAGSMDGETNYIKPLGRRGNIALMASKWSGDPIAVWEYNCSAWEKRLQGGTRGWSPIYPGSVADTNARRVC